MVRSIVVQATGMTGCRVAGRPDGAAFAIRAEGVGAGLIFWLQLLHRAKGGNRLVAEKKLKSNDTSRLYQHITMLEHTYIKSI